MDVRPLRDDDVAAVRAVAAAVDQDHEDAFGDWSYVTHLQRTGDVVVAESDGQLVGYAATHRLGALTMLSDLFVHPDRHGRGVGRALLDTVWSTPGARLTFSSMHPAAVPLYTSFGLTPAWPLYYLTGDPSRLPRPAGYEVHLVDIDEAAAWEHAVTGLDRRLDYAYWSGRPDGGCLLVSRGADVVAAGAVGGQGEQYGLAHLTVIDADPRVTVSALTALRGAGEVRVPGPHPAFPVLLAAGWRAGYVDQFMVRGDPPVAADGWCPHPGLG